MRPPAVSEGGAQAVLGWPLGGLIVSYCAWVQDAHQLTNANARIGNARLDCPIVELDSPAN